jgi:uncharacterized membrane protein YgdD (TMEM256/DUF423 family)
MDRLFFAIGALMGALGVAFGAFGAHGLKARVTPDLLQIWETAAHYHLIHALALIAASWAMQRFPGSLSVAAGWCFLFGILIFSGSLYTLAFTGIRWLGAITPIGGVLFIVGWVLLALAAFKR